MSVAAIGDFQVIDRDIILSLNSLEKNSGPKNTFSEVRCSRGLPLSLIDSLIRNHSRTEVQASLFYTGRGLTTSTTPYQAVKASTLVKWLLETTDRAGVDTAL